MSKHEFLIEELLLRWDKHFERLLSILEKGQNAKDGGDNGTKHQSGLATRYSTHGGLS